MFILINTQYLEDYGTRHKFKGGHNFAVEVSDLGDALAMVHLHLWNQNLNWHTLGISLGKSHAPNIEFPIVPAMDGSVFEFQSLDALVEQCPEWEPVIHLRANRVIKTIASRIKNSWEMPSAPAPADAPTEHDSPARLEQVLELPSDDAL